MREQKSKDLEYERDQKSKVLDYEREREQKSKVLEYERERAKGEGIGTKGKRN